MGGGRMEMLPREAADPEYPKDSSKAGSRNDGNLIGLFEPSHMQFKGNRMNDVGGEPSLSEMVEKVIEILQKDKDGFFLMVEDKLLLQQTGGRIDHAHHDGLAYHALHDTIAMDKAVAKAMSMTNEMETLFIVTADHSHVLSIGGAADRGSPILGRGGLMNDGLPFTTLSYANGPGGIEELNSFKSTGSRRNLTDTNTESADFHHPALVPIDSETHGGEDVTIYANGPMSHLFHGVHEQHYIAHVRQNQTESDERENPKTLAAKGDYQNWLTVGNDLQRQQERGQTAGSGLGCSKERWLTVGCGDDNVTHLPKSRPLRTGSIK
ncbi:intestinal-type alkaline phosphatase 1-like [Asterias amurensis]|uniref:intestinal-type alkaline phosphatase 1-like n=1 Tax=Asterias amurensis TaxID=7602 RepID=UPI003AB4709B